MTRINRRLSASLLALLLIALSAAAQQTGPAASPLRAGYAATANPAYNQMLRDAGLNTAFWAIRPAPAMDLQLDDQGRVFSAGIDPAMEQGLRIYIQLAQEQGLELYAKVGFFPAYVEQLQALGPYQRVVVQGPTRYLSPGEKPGPAPLERKYWLGQLLCEAQYIARLALEYPHIKGFLFDVEMYAGAIMWRRNSSFDDQTFFAALAELAPQPSGELLEEARTAPPEARYQWLEQHGLLLAYFDAQERLVQQIAAEFRQAVHDINPDLTLGFLPYEGNWFYDGWARGLATPERPVLICSEQEYVRGITPSALATAARLRDLGIPARYLPAFYLRHHSPVQLAEHAALANQLFNGYWLFTTYSLWQPDPEILWGPYRLQADRRQYVAALARANAGDVQPLSLYQHPAPLLTGNAHYEGPRSPRPLLVSYSPEPDVPFYTDPQHAKLFDGLEIDSPGTVAWYADRNEQIAIDLDFRDAVLIDRLLLRAGHILAEHHRVRAGTITVLTSEDGEMYYPLSERTLSAGGAGENIAELVGDHGTLLIREKLGIRARYLRITMETTEAGPPYSVWAVSELAVWGRE